MLQKVIVKVSQQDGVGHCFDKNSLKSTEKCQILKKKKTNSPCLFAGSASLPKLSLPDTPLLYLYLIHYCPIPKQPH